MKKCEILTSKVNLLVMAALVTISMLLSACTSYTEDGELIRHHIGYVRVTTPSMVAGDHPLQALEVETIGLWVDVDQRNSATHTGSGGGFGYRFDRREFIPVGCRVVFRLQNKVQIEEAVRLLNINNTGGSDICVIRDTWE